MTPKKNTNRPLTLPPEISSKAASLGLIIEDETPYGNGKRQKRSMVERATILIKSLQEQSLNPSRKADT